MTFDDGYLMRGIIHCDIKGANILVDNRGGIKISDFGISKKMGDDILASVSRGDRAFVEGSLFWMAPEVVNLGRYSPKSDIWSVGCVLVEMLTGRHSFPKLSRIQAIFQIGSFVKLENPQDISSDAEDFLSGTFEAKHTARPSAEELIQHAWVRSV